MSDRYKHISEKAARKASDELARVRTEQRTEARAKLREPSAKTATALIDSAITPAVLEAGGSNRSEAVH